MSDRGIYSSGGEFYRVDCIMYCREVKEGESWIVLIGFGNKYVWFDKLYFSGMVGEEV